MQAVLKSPSLPPLTLGAAQLGLPYGIANRAGRPDEARAFEILRTALANGVSAFDTAARYGDSEKVIGRFLAAERPRPMPLIVSKAIGGLAEISDAGRAAALLRAQVRQSLDRLGIERLPVCLLHQPDDLMRNDALVAGAFRELAGEGLIRRAGISVYRPEEADVMLRHDIFQVIQIPVNIFDQRWRRSGVLQRLAESGVSVFARSVYLQGLFFLTPEEAALRVPGAAGPLRRLRDLAGRAGLDPDVLAFVYVRDLSGIDSLVIGCETARQVRDNAALLQAPPAAPEIRAEAEAIFAEVGEDVLNPARWGISYAFSDAHVARAGEEASAEPSAGNPPKDDGPANGASAGGGMRASWREIWRRRELVGLLALRTLKIRYKNAALGFFWSLLGPLFLIVIYAIFLGILKIEIDLHVLIVGIIAWHYLSTCANDGLHAVMGNANLVRKTAFPRLILPLSMVLANTVNFLLSGIVLAVFLAARGVGFGANTAWLPLIILTHLAFCLGMGCIVSALNVFFRDTEHLLSVALMAWFFMTPVVYPVGFITERMSLPPLLLYAYFANPMTGIVSAYRSSLLGEPFPFLRTAMLSFLIAWTVLPLGLAFFQRMQIRFADEL